MQVLNTTSQTPLVDAEPVLSVVLSELPPDNAPSAKVDEPMPKVDEALATADEISAKVDEPSAKVGGPARTLLATSSSEVITSARAEREAKASSEVIRGHQRSSEVIRARSTGESTGGSNGVIREPQRSSEVLRDHQR